LLDFKARYCDRDNASGEGELTQSISGGWTRFGEEGNALD
jgi:hypothetical protein